MYSITSRLSFEQISRFKTQISRVKDSESIPIVLVGNKADKVNEREVGKEEGMGLARRLGCGFVEVSAKTRMNLEEAYFMVVRNSEYFDPDEGVTDGVTVRAQRDGQGGTQSGRKKGAKKGAKCTVL